MKKTIFYTADIEWKTGYRFLCGGIFDGKKYESFKKEDDFFGALLSVRGTVFFHYLDADARLILDYCEKKNIPHEKMPIISGEKKIIYWKIGETTFRDSAILTQASLKELSESFHLKTKKISIGSYDFKNPTKKVMQYLKNDVLALHEALTAFYSFVGWEYFNKRSIASIALGKFKQMDSHAYKMITETAIVNPLNDFIHEAYFTSYWDSFANELGDGEYEKWDVNSFYAAAMRDNYFPYGMVVETSNKEELAFYFSNRIGIVEAEVRIPKGLTIGFLPLKKEGEVEYPIKGKMHGIWTTPEIEYAKELGYQFEFIYGVFWDFKEKFFKKYVSEIGRIKEHSRGAKKAIAKRLLVSLYGKFGERREVRILRRTKEPLMGHRYLDDALTICEDTIRTKKPYSHPEISAFTTAYARIMFYRFCSEVGWDRVLAVMIDSAIIRTDGLNRDFRKKWIHKTKIGKFKVVSRIKDMIILARGVYALKDENGDEIIRNQGGMPEFNKMLTWDDFKRASKKKIWNQYKGLKRHNTVYDHLAKSASLRGFKKAHRSVKIRKK